MHDNGLTDLSNGCGKPTKLQQTAYVMAKSYWQEKQREDTDNGGTDTTTLPSNSNTTTERQFDWSKETANTESSTDDDSNPLFDDDNTQRKFQEMRHEEMSS